MDSFLGVPVSTTYTSLSPQPVLVNGNLVPILPAKPLLSVYPKTTTVLGSTTVLGPSTAFYYDSGIGESPLARHQTNVDLRYKFLDKWLLEDYPEILQKLKVENGVVVPLNDTEAKNNDISKDTIEDIEKKADYIGLNILSKDKNMRILEKMCQKNNMKFYDLPHNEFYVRKEQAKYILKKMKEIS